MENNTYAIQAVMPTGNPKVTENVEIPKTYYLAGIAWPTLTTSTAITFDVSADGLTWLPLYNNGTAYSITVTPATAAATAVSKDIFYPWNHIRIKVANDQAAARTFTLFLRQY